uniref:Uncharacterized protein n=1 Tax=Megaselia scalaris TaxID=36166 RepID=T1GDP3_MEGSC
MLNTLETFNKVMLRAKQGSSRHILWSVKVSVPLGVGREYFSSKLRDNCNRRWKLLDSFEVTMKTWCRFDERASNSLITLGRNSLRKIVNSF